MVQNFAFFADRLGTAKAKLLIDRCGYGLHAELN
jgi:hypothetical protein